MTLVEPTWNAAREAAWACADVLPAEEVSVAEAIGRTVAEAVLARTPLPAFDTSSMDGYAVSGPAPWRLVGEVLAGAVSASELLPGTCVRIATGAAVPSGATAILRWEAAQIGPDGMVGGQVEEGRDIRPAGEEATVGTELVADGTTLGPADLGLAAAGGADTMTVRAVPRAGVVVFGDELLDSGPSRDGRVRDSLGPQLPGWLSRLSVRTESVTRVPDRLDAHVDAIARADTDLVVTTGGTAGGPVDHLHAALAQVGAEIVVDSVAVRPGHPMVLARRDRQWVLGLPGNPQSAVVALLSLGWPVIEAMLGRPLAELERCTLDDDLGAPPGETRLVLATLRGSVARPVPHLGSGMLRGLTRADGFAVVQPGGQRAGSAARWLRLP